MSNLPIALCEALSELGTAITPQLIQQTSLLLAPTAARPAPSFCSVERDLAYGPHERHRLDVFVPVAAGQSRPILVYVHGGGFTMGSKGGPDDPFFNNFGAWAARAGFVGATLNYRLAPSHQWPAGPEDLDAAVTWLRDHAAQFGGDADKIVLVGQSAGAVHVAGYLTLAKHDGRAPLAAAILLSGIFDLERHQGGLPSEVLYYGDDPARRAEQSTLAGLFQQCVPCLFTVSELDPPTFQRQAAHLVEHCIAVHDRLPRLIYLSGHNHLTPGYSLGGADSAFSELLERFVRQMT